MGKKGKGKGKKGQGEGKDKGPKGGNDKGGKCQGQSGGKGKGQGNDGWWNQSQAGGACRKCGLYGHYKRDCPQDVNHVRACTANPGDATSSWQTWQTPQTRFSLNDVMDLAWMAATGSSTATLCIPSVLRMIKDTIEPGSNCRFAYGHDHA